MASKKQTDTYIEQRYSNDCGIAALAMLYRQPYERICRLVLKAEPGAFDGTRFDHARAVGKSLRSACGMWGANPDSRPEVIKRLKGRAAVLIVPAKDHRISGDWHAVYWTGKEILDPSPTGKYGRKGIKALKTFVEAWIIRHNPK